MENVDVDEMMIVKWILKLLQWRRVDSSLSAYGSLAGFIEEGNYLSSDTESEEILE
jgi:hypothetical protein